MNIITARVTENINMGFQMIPKGMVVEIEVRSTGLYLRGNSLDDLKSLDIDWNSVLELSTLRVVKMTAPHFIEGEIALSKYGHYNAQEICGIYFIDLCERAIVIPSTLFELLAAEVSVSLTDKYTRDTEDAWSYIAQETGVQRHIVKAFLFAFILGNQNLLELARDHKLSAQNMRYLISTFDQWSGAQE